MSIIKSKRDNSKHSPQTQIEKDYNKIVQRAQKQPGINDILKLYGQMQEGLKQSQDYLQLIQPIEPSSSSNSSSLT